MPNDNSTMHAFMTNKQQTERLQTQREQPSPLPLLHDQCSLTPLTINIEPENDGLEDDFPFSGCILRFHVNLPGCTKTSSTSSQRVFVHLPRDGPGRE